MLDLLEAVNFEVGISSAALNIDEEFAATVARLLARAHSDEPLAFLMIDAMNFARAHMRGLRGAGGTLDSYLGWGRDSKAVVSSKPMGSFRRYIAVAPLDWQSIKLVGNPELTGFTMIRSRTIAILFGLSCFAVNVVAAADWLPAGVACLLEDNAAELLPQLSNPGGDLGDGEVEKDDVFAGRTAIKITNYQRYFNLLPGWAFRITENPAEGEYRYLRFAWKSDGLTGIMLQLHDDRDWNIRYTAGANKFGWATNTVAPSPPNDWTVVTMDLFKDFGAREIHGIAFTAFDGTAGYFDHVYLARTIGELDAIDATGLRDGDPLSLTPDEVETQWKQLSSPDASIAYRSFWTLAAAGGSARVLLAAKAGGEVADVDTAKITEWLQQLDHEEFAVREQATAKLTAQLAQARVLMEAELKRTGSAEVRARLGQILKGADQPMSEETRLKQLASRILRIIAERAK